MKKMGNTVRGQVERGKYKNVDGEEKVEVEEKDAKKQNLGEYASTVCMLQQNNGRL